MAKKHAEWEMELPEDERAALGAYLAGIRGDIRLPRAEADAIVEDFRGLFRYYRARGMRVAQGIERVGNDPLGGFYREPDAKMWFPLDSAAKVYPLAMTRSMMSVFRVSAYLTAPVEPTVLQAALTLCVKRFPIFASTLRAGVFWHYIDPVRRHFTCRQEKDMPCVPINISTRRAPCFQVRYFGRRVSLEVFHILADGTGAMTFLKSLVAVYGRLTGHEIPSGDGVLDVGEPPREDEMTDDFHKGDRADRGGGFLDRMARQLPGRRTAAQPAKLIQFILPAAKLRACAKARGVTVTAFVLALLFTAARMSMPPRKGDLAIQVPVNMRRFYPSRTVRNFSMYAILRVPVREAGDLEKTIPRVADLLKKGTQKETLDRMMRTTRMLVKNPLIRVMPLFIKQAIFRVAYPLVGEGTLTTTLSNLGVVPNDFRDMVEGFDFALGPCALNKASCAMITFRDRAVLSVTKTTLDPAFEDNLRALFASAGLAAEERSVSPYREGKR